MRKTMILLCFVLGWGTISIFAQSGTVATGGQATGAGGSVSCSIGQVNYISASGSGTVYQGLQQPYEIVDGIGLDATPLDLTVTLFPNPTTDLVTLKVSKYDELSYQIYDNEGRIVANEDISSNETSISMSKYENATYFIKIQNKQNKSKTFKIFKNY